jgi:hypothetical protein
MENEKCSHPDGMVAAFQDRKAPSKTWANTLLGFPPNWRP